MAQEKKADKLARALEVERRMGEHYPEPECALHYRTPFELTIAVALSAQTTDVNVNKVTPTLFARFGTPEAMAQANVEEVADIIHSLGFFRNKAKNCVACAQMIMSDFGGEVPRDMKSLQKLPGVGRKTANVIRGNIYNEPSIVVDTHVKRISKRLGLTKEEDPVKIEYELMKVLPKDHWILYNIQIITFGRGICFARSPKCEECFLKAYCVEYGERQKAQNRKKRG